MADDQSVAEVYPGVNWAAFPTELVDILPRHKADTERAQAAAALADAELQPVVPLLTTWLKDANWPVATVIAPRLSSLGAQLKETVENVLVSDDETWKYWVLALLVDIEDLQLARTVEPVLIRQVTTGDDPEGVSELARKILGRLADRGD